MRTLSKIIILILLGSQSSAFALRNPAAVNCLNTGNRYILIKNIGVCLFPDGSYCEEWAYFRGQCKPGQNQSAIGSVAPADSNNGYGSPSS